MKDPVRDSALAVLQRTMRSCRRCLDAGYEVYPPAVFSGGRRARVLLIGQAPGITEQQAGRPFNAGSGTRLFQWLAEAGIEEHWFRANQYMTSVTKCYPGRSGGGSGDRVPSRAEQELCRPYLDQEIELVDPELIIPIGRLAINLFFPRSLSLAKIVGTEVVHRGRAVVPLPHPSGASRWHQSENNRALIQQSLERIALHLRRLRITPKT